MSRRLYLFIINSVDKYVPTKLRPLWEHPAGPKTVFFWSPLFKWALVLAGLGDMISVPVDKISFNQSLSLGITGIIWARYSLVIIPCNYNLFAVNAFLGAFQSTQAIRAYRYQRSQAILEEQKKEYTEKSLKKQEHSFDKQLSKGYKK